MSLPRARTRSIAVELDATRGHAAHDDKGTFWQHHATEPLVEVDCASRLFLCHSACCRKPFWLSKEDVDRGIAYSPDQPYQNLKGFRNYCVHNSPTTHQCKVYEDRPNVCRAYDCSKDESIWLDFEARVINPDIRKGEWPNIKRGREDRCSRGSQDKDR